MPWHGGGSELVSGSIVLEPTPELVDSGEVDEGSVEEVAFSGNDSALWVPAPVVALSGVAAFGGPVTWQAENKHNPKERPVEGRQSFRAQLIVRAVPGLATLQVVQVFVLGN